SGKKTSKPRREPWLFLCGWQGRGGATFTNLSKPSCDSSAHPAVGTAKPSRHPFVRPAIASPPSASSHAQSLVALPFFRPASTWTAVAADPAFADLPLTAAF